MGYSVSTSFVVVFLAVLVATGTLYTAADNAVDRAVEAGADELEDEREQLRTDFAIEDATYYTLDGRLLVDLRNVGATTLAIAATDLLVDDAIASSYAISRAGGDPDTDVWKPGETLHLAVEADDPARLKVVSEHGVARSTAIVRRAVTANWPTFGYDDASTAGATNATGPESGVGKRWNVSTGGDVRSSPAVVGRTLYVGSNDTDVYAIDTRTGEVIWTHSTGGAVRSSPTVANGVVYVGSDDGDVYALDADDGSVVWTYSTGGAIRSSPTVANGVVYVGSDDGSVYAIHAANGTEKWTYSTADKGITTDLAGSVLSDTSGGPVRVVPAVYNASYDASVHLVYVGTDSGAIHAVYANNGTNKWVTLLNSGRMVRSSPAAANGTVFVGTFAVGSLGAINGHFYALDAETGTEEWSATDLNAFSIQTRSSPAVDDGTVYVPDVDDGGGTLHALDAADGDEVWSFDLGNETRSSPAVVNGSTVFVADDGGMVYGLYAANGTERWSFWVRDRARSSPAVALDALYVGTDGDGVWAIEGD